LKTKAIDLSQKWTKESEVNFTSEEVFLFTVTEVEMKNLTFVQFKYESLNDFDRYYLICF
jgi:hypothetical protein